MKDNLIINKIFTVFEGSFNPDFVRRTEPRRCDGLCYYLNGSASYLFKNQTLNVSSGDVLFLPENGEYNIQVNEPTSYVCIDFSFSEKGLSPIVIHNLKTLKNDFYKFLYNWLKPSSVKTPKAYEILNHIYCELITAKNKGYSNYYNTYSNAMDIIIKNYRNQDFTVEKLANEMDFSPTHLRRIFLSCQGNSPKKTINDIRLEQSKLLLTTSNLSISEISLSVGFCDQFHFSKLFKERFSLSPMEYRKRFSKP